MQSVFFMAKKWAVRTLFLGMAKCCKTIALTVPFKISIAQIVKGDGFLKPEQTLASFFRRNSTRPPVMLQTTPIYHPRLCFRFLLHLSHSPVQCMDKICGHHAWFRQVLDRHFRDSATNSKLPGTETRRLKKDFFQRNHIWKFLPRFFNQTAYNILVTVHGLKLEMKLEIGK